MAIYRKVHRWFRLGEPEQWKPGPNRWRASGCIPRARQRCCRRARPALPELYRRQVSAGAEVFLVPAAWPAARIGHWSLLGRARAIENQCVLIACNTAGTHAGYEMGGRSQVVSARGEVLAKPGRARRCCRSTSISPTWRPTGRGSGPRRPPPPPVDPRRKAGSGSSKGRFRVIERPVRAVSSRLCASVELGRTAPRQVGRTLTHHPATHRPTLGNDRAGDPRPHV